VLCLGRGDAVVLCAATPFIIGIMISCMAEHHICCCSPLQSPAELPRPNCGAPSH
jgi:hypothetical protein